MTYLATEWFTCEECTEVAAHEWHVLATPKGVKAPTIAISECQHCSHTSVWVNGDRAWPQQAEVATSRRAALTERKRRSAA